MSGWRAAGRALPSPDPSHQGLKALGTLDLIGGIGEGHGAPVASVPPTMPLPNSPDSNPAVQGAVAPWWGEVRRGAKPLYGSALTRLIATLPLLWALAGPATAAVGRPEDRLPDPAMEARAQEIGRELRCMVCQNQSIEDSDAELARDLRRVVRERVVAGDDSSAIMRFVHARYGDFVLLRPPFNPVTALLWAMPVLAVGGGLVVIVLRRRRVQAAVEPAPLTEAEQRRLIDLDRVR